jgi:hypothetical protein
MPLWFEIAVLLLLSWIAISVADIHSNIARGAERIREAILERSEDRDSNVSSTAL